MHLLTAVEQADLIRRRELSSEELTRHYLDRIDRLDRQLASFVEVRPERAIAAARRLDASSRRDRAATRSPLWGIPTGLKDLHFTRGFFARMGSRAFRYVWSPFDDVTSRTVRNAGMVIAGKLATSELAILPVVDTDLHPPTRNPWSLDRYSGGSSGGSAAAIAAGLLPLASASDGAGSIRIPAAFCGLVGLKTTRDLVPNPHRTFETVGLSVIGPHARSVDDAAALLDVLTSRWGTPQSFADAARVRPPRLRLHVTTRSPVVDTEPCIADAVLRVAKALESLGHSVDEAPTLRGSIDEFMPMFQFLAANSPVLSDRALQPSTRWLREIGRSVTHEQALAARELFVSRVGTWFGDVDAWLTPTVARRPPAVGAWRHRSGRDVVEEAAPYGGFTAAFNASGHPAITIPVRIEGQAWPVGVQIVGRQGDDGRLLALARTVLEAMNTPTSPIATLPNR